MNAEPPAQGLAGVLKSLNCDRGYGIALICVCALLAAPEIVGDGARLAGSFDRAAIAEGQWWRLLTAHFVHLDLEHAVLNSLGVVLMWALFARDYSPWRWAAIYSGAALSVSLGLWFLNPQLQWYVGASGALHGVMTAGTVAHLRRRDLDGWILAVFIVAKLAYEQYAGALPFAGSSATIVDAHLYGAIGGLAVALFLQSRRL
ncbi:MAG TPA: rhombosortase [Steroidobacteraceae bacterium]|jgi:rhomboid family GlyGly-CTERM serine protease|nr:rhombosortase [Steroidobacteraceae bacterium]